jgi:N6-L-threonylcarbamoyladenine synthase
MLMLGIESSCDETAAAVVAEVEDPARPWQIRSSIVASQVEIHREWGGVVPELASRQHIRDICGVVERALGDASVTLRDLDAIAVTQGPGLVGSLLVGLSFAKSLAASANLPLVPVHHLAGHIESLFLHHGPLPLPAAVLVVSGGHTSLFEVREPGAYRLLGRTRDDAAGEAYDKVAKLLGLGYPGGPIIDRIAPEGDDRAFDLPVARMTHPDRNAPGEPGRLDFSFSGIKTAVLRHVRAQGPGAGGQEGHGEAREGRATDPIAPGSLGRPRSRPLRQGPPHAPEASEQAQARFVVDLCASFQRSVVEALLDRTFEAAAIIGARSIGIAGGVSANSRLRADATARGRRAGLPVFLPPLALSTDNAAMIAAAGLRRYHQGIRAGLDLNADASLRL